MKFKRLHGILFLIGTLILCMSIVGGDSLDMEANAIIGMNKTVITVKDPHSSNNKAFFTIKNMEDLSDRNITFTAASATEIESKTVNVIGTNSDYPNFSHMLFNSGCFFDKTAAASRDRVVVVDEKLAWDVFRSLNVVGNTMKIFNKEFKIIGVIAPDKSIVGLLSDSGIPHAFIPANTLLELDKTAPISSLQIQNQDTSLSGQNYTEAVNVLGILAKTPKDYYISDLNIQRVLIAQKPRILVFIAGLASITVLLGYLIRRGKEAYQYIRNECQSDYIENVLKYNQAILLRRFLIILLPLSAIVWFWMKIRFDMYIPPEYLPKELIDLAFYFDLFKKSISESIANRGYIAPLIEIRLNSIIMLSDWLFYSGLLIGLPMIWLGLKLSKWDDVIPWPRTLWALGWAFIGSISLSTIIVWLSGIPLNLNITDLAVVFSFIYIFAIKLFNEGKVKRCEKNVYHPDIGTDCM